MSAVPAVDPHGFRRILYRNIALPLIVGVISVLGFVALIAYLLSTMNQVERSDRIIAETYAAAKLAVDQETGMRGFLLSGNESFLEPYRLGKPRMQAQLDALEQLVVEDGQQVQRIRLIKSLHDQWTLYVEDVLAQPIGAAALRGADRLAVEPLHRLTVVLEPRRVGSHHDQPAHPAR